VVYMVDCPRLAGSFPKRICENCFYYQDEMCKYRELFNPRNIKRD